MQNTSVTWKTLAAKMGSGVHLESKAIINGVEYTNISAPLISRAVMSNGFSIGNVVSATCQLSVRTNDTIPKSAEVQIQMRLTDDTTTSEWLPAGTFYVSKRKKDPMMGVVTFECYDALLKANVVVPDTVPWTTNTGERITDGNGNDIYISAAYPRDMLGMVNDIAGILGIDVDSRTQIITSSGYSIPAPSNEAVTIRDILSVIATANCGNWVVTPDNKLRLVPVNSASNAASATNDVVDIIAVLNDTSTGTETQTISGIRNTYDDTVYFTGDETGIVVDVSTVPAIAAEIAETLIGKTYQAYELANAVYDPAEEIGDYVRRSDTISSILCVESVELGNLFVGNISAPDPSEIDDEFPYIGTGAKSVAISKAYAREVTAELDSSLDQESVFNRLTDNGAAQGIYLVDGQLYVSASYIQTGTMVANLIKGGTLQVAGDSYWDSTGLHVKSGAIELRQSSAFGLNISEYGDLAIGTLPSNMSSFDGNRCGFQVNNHGDFKSVNIKIYGEPSSGANYVQYGSIVGTPANTNDGSPAGMILLAWDGSGVSSAVLYVLTDGIRVYGEANVSGGLSVSIDANISRHLSVGGDAVITGDLDVSGDLDVTGAVSCSNIPYYGGPPFGECDTAAATQEKVVTITGITDLRYGMSIRVLFKNAQGYNGNPTLNLNSLGAKYIYRTVPNNTQAAVQYEWGAGEVLDLVYDGSEWIIVNGGSLKIG